LKRRFIKKIINDRIRRINCIRSRINLFIRIIK